MSGKSEEPKKRGRKPKIAPTLPDSLTEQVQPQPQQTPQQVELLQVQQAEQLPPEADEALLEGD